MAKMSKNDFPFIEEYLITGLHYYQNYRFKFKHPTNVIVGESGLGKTKILHLLYLSLTKRWIALSKHKFDFIYIKFGNGKSLRIAKGELEFYILSNNSDLLINDQRDKIHKKFYEIEATINSTILGHVIYFPVYRNVMDDLGMIGKNYAETRFPNDFNPAELTEALDIEAKVLIPSTLDQLISLNKQNKGDDNLIKLIQLCNSYLLGVKLYFSKTTVISIRNQITDEIVDLDQLSSGEKQLVYFFLKVYFSIAPCVYVLFDEPELSIPIEWQRKLLKDLTQFNKISFLLAITHSPFIFDNEYDEFTSGINIYKFLPE